ncbi:conserved hypothetical protein [Borreliella afzelii PKo]|uniref:Uncharacterized protein n=1 Tax=Borreliella afzelii (strain PKo) TaxID=390236 RepID=Q0SN46_BORAP|nr:hypothetical protein BAPKO_0489 [Borreliella afzelii PKo]AEL69686.1 conserved hypothetical protein [Borreliella afzelii PKo]EEC21386.1 conserved hypothetical protein [Borreliella afzelii ACA-1]
MYHGFESHSLRFLGPVLSSVAKPRQDWKVAAVGDFFGEYASLRFNFEPKCNALLYVKIWIYLFKTFNLVIFYQEAFFVRYFLCFIKFFGTFFKVIVLRYKYVV